MLGPRTNSTYEDVWAEEVLWCCFNSMPTELVCFLPSVYHIIAKGMNDD